jgi:UDP-N-acetyl-D-mannosaminuronic acid transferase (WecB/TagA/CpsF family)
MRKAPPTVRILGIDFYNGSLEQIIEIVRYDGGLILAPSGPGLAELGKNPQYDAALVQADLNLIDSGYLALLWRKQTGQILQRHSGLKFIQALVEHPGFQAESKQLWVMPSDQDTEATNHFLGKQGIQLEPESFYKAPFYSGPAVTDPALLQRVRESRPNYVIICIAGGKQEVLGHWLREQLDYQPAIICVGAAIAFLSGRQARIPPWADRIYIGWLLRILRKPDEFLPRYWKARKLSKLVKAEVSKTGANS